MSLQRWCKADGPSGHIVGDTTEEGESPDRTRHRAPNLLPKQPEKS